MPDGILLVDKPAGDTSAGIVRRLKRVYRPRRIGHLGTLDPMATGVLPLCIDGGTRIARYLEGADKAYEGEIRLGIATDTLDITGEEIRRAPVPDFGTVDLDAVAHAFLGESEQVPPMYSAVKVDGQELYKHARAGREVERRARPIRIDRFSLQPGGEPETLRFSVDCSKGTYVRVLAEDVGAALGCPATLASLRRTRFGAFGVAECRTLDVLETEFPEQAPVIPSLDALRGVPQCAVDGRTAWEVAVGRKGALRSLPEVSEQERMALLAPDGALLAIVESEGPRWRLARVLYPQAADLYRPQAEC